MALLALRDPDLAVRLLRAAMRTAAGKNVHQDNRQVLLRQVRRGQPPLQRKRGRGPWHRNWLPVDGNLGGAAAHWTY